MLLTVHILSLHEVYPFFYMYFLQCSIFLLKLNFAIVVEGSMSCDLNTFLKLFLNNTYKTTLHFWLHFSILIEFFLQKRNC